MYRLISVYRDIALTGLDTVVEPVPQRYKEPFAALINACMGRIGIVGGSPPDGLPLSVLLPDGLPSGPIGIAVKLRA